LLLLPLFFIIALAPLATATPMATLASVFIKLISVTSPFVNYARSVL
jgi:hypothetical protein